MGFVLILTVSAVYLYAFPTATIIYGGGVLLHVGVGVLLAVAVGVGPGGGQTLLVGSSTVRNAFVRGVVVPSPNARLVL